MAGGRLTSLPIINSRLRTNNRRGATITNAPERGKAFIYGIEWGFRIDKSNTYGARGTYIGLTHDAVIKRWYTHMMEAKKLKVYYDRGSDSTGVIGGDKSTKEGRLLYIAMATSLWKKQEYIFPGFAYRAIKVLEEVNLFDLAYAERKRIKDENTKSGVTSGKNYRYIFEAAMGNGGNGLGLNATDGGERNFINNTGVQLPTGGVEKEIVLAAFYFIKEGRGAGELRGEIGISGMSKDTNPESKIKSNKKDSKMLQKVYNSYPAGVVYLALDIRKVLVHFQKASGFEKYNRKMMSVETIAKYCQSLGLSYGEGGTLVLSDKEQKLNAILSVKNQPDMPLHSGQVSYFYDYAQSGQGLSRPSYGLSIKLIGTVNVKTAKQIAVYMAQQPFFVSGVGKVMAIQKLEGQINKMNGVHSTSDPKYISLAYYKILAMKDMDKAFEELKNRFGAGKINSLLEQQEGNTKVDKYIQKYNATKGYK